MSWTDKLKELGVNIHVVATGGGAGLQQRLWEVPGSSSYLSGASFPYDQTEQEELLGFMPTQFCSEEAAIDLASAAYMKAYKFGGKKPVGVGLTASVASERAHRGDHRVHGCIITDNRIKTYTLVLEKGVGQKQRIRDGEDCDYIGEVMLTDVLGLGKINIHKNIVISEAQEDARAQFFKRPFFCHDGRRLDNLSNTDDYALMSGSFNPPHSGHLGMADQFRRSHGKNVVFEIGTNPPHKDPPTVQELLQRAKMLRGRDVLFTRDIPKYLEKSNVYPKMPMILGADTLLRILDPKWGIQPRDVIRSFINNQSTLFVTGRLVDGKFTTRDDIVKGLPAEVTNGFDMRIFQSLDGRWDVSSSELRAQIK